MCHGQILGLGLRVALSPKYSLRLATYHSDMDSIDLKEKQSLLRTKYSLSHSTCR
jgi:hypothetical protein